LVEACRSDQRTDACETLSSEVIPLCDALRFLGRRGPGILKPRKLGVRGRPLWLWGVRSEVRRVPLGDVLILAAWNYPLLLPGVQIAQALAGGNRVFVKPAPGCERATELLVACFHEAGVPSDRLVGLGSRVESATERIDAGVDLIVLTGGVATGKAVLRRAAETLTPSIMELSGCDAVIALPGCDVDRLAAAIRFGLTFNAGATCIGPRRLFVVGDELESAAEARIREQLSGEGVCIVHPSAMASTIELIDQAMRCGAKDGGGRFDRAKLAEHRQLHPLMLTDVPREARILSADLFAPVISVCRVGNVEDAILAVNRCGYRLAASVFGPDDQAGAVADRLDVGSVTVNDLIAPTADPRLPFGGRGDSGFGVTRGREGLLAMTAVKVVTVRRGKLLPHLSPRGPADVDVLSAAVKLMHGKGWGQKWDGLRQAAKAVKNQSKVNTKNEKKSS